MNRIEEIKAEQKKLEEELYALRGGNSRSENEEDFYKIRKNMLGQITSEELIESPFVYCKRQLITTALTRIELFKMALETQGAIVECGVHKANSLMLYYHLSSIFEPYNFHRKIIGFDTFEGFRSLSKNDNNDLSEKQFSDTNYDHIIEWIKLQDKNRTLNHIEKCELIKGDATVTIPKYVEENKHLIISLLYLDFDIYEPTNIALKYLLPLVPKGGVVGFDEVNCKEWIGETVALKENIILNKIKLKKFAYDPWVSYYLVD